MVKNNTLYSLSQFCKKFLGINLCVVENCVTIRQILDQNGFENLWDYPLSEIDHAMQKLGLSSSTFYRIVRQYEGK